MAVPPRVGFQPRTTPAERRAFFHQQRQLADLATTGGGGGGDDVLWVGPDAPTDPDIELWYDTDEIADEVYTAAEVDALLANHYTETEVDALLAAAAGTVTTWTPTVTGLTPGNGTQTAYYLKQGRSCTVTYQFTLGSTSAVTGLMHFSLPFTALSWGATGAGSLYQGGDVGQRPATALMWDSLSDVALLLYGYDANESNLRETTGAIPWNWTVGNGTGDFFSWSMTYVTAS